MAKALTDEGYKVLMVDQNYANEYAARMGGLPTHAGDILSENILDEIDLEGIGRFLALTSNDEANSLAVLNFREIFGHAEVYQLYPLSLGRDDLKKRASHLRGRFLFAEEMTHTNLTERFEKGAVVKTTKLTPEFTYEAFQSHYGAEAIPLFLINEKRELKVFTADFSPAPKPHHTLISLAPSEKK